VLDFIISLFFILLFYIECFFIGFVVLHNKYVMLDTESVLCSIFFMLVLGIGIHILILFLLGITYTLNASTFLCINAGMIAVFYKQISKMREVIKEHRCEFCYAVLLMLVSSLAACQMAGYWDDTMYHLPMVRYYIENNGFALAYFLRFPLFPQNIDVLFCIPGMIFGCNNYFFEYSCQILQAIIFAIFIIGCAGLSDVCFKTPVPGLLASLFVLCVYPIREYWGWAYIDFGLMLFSFAALFSMMRFFDEKENRIPYLCISAFCGGITVGAKLFGAVYIGILGIIFLIFEYKNVKNIVLFSSIVILVGCAWYVRSFVISGDPVSPLGGPVFGYFLWDAKDLECQIMEQGTHGVTKSMTYMLPALQKINAVFVSAVFALLLIWDRLSKGSRLAACVTITYLIFWLYITQVNRYILPLLGGAVFCMAYIIYAMYTNFIKKYKNILSHKYITYIFLFIFMIVFVNESLAVYKSRENISHRKGLELFCTANENIDSYGNVLVQIGFEDMLYFFKGMALGDHFGILKYREVISEEILADDGQKNIFVIISSDKMLNILNKHGAKMLVVNSTMFTIDMEDYKRNFDILHKTKDGILFAIKDLHT